MLTKEMIIIMTDEELLENFYKKESFNSEEVEMLREEIDTRRLTPLNSLENRDINDKEDKEIPDENISSEEKMITCSYCSHKNKNMSKFCEKCGISLEKNYNSKDQFWIRLGKTILVVLGILFIVFIVLPAVGLLLLAGTCMAILGSAGH